MIISKLKWPVGLLLALLVAVYGYCALFSSFAGFDDEGYILQSAQAYLKHGGLYTVVYTQYGPAFYALIDGWHRLTGAVVDHSFARWATLVLWLGCAGALAGVVARATASWSLALFTLIASFLWLHLQAHEPFHPGSLILFLAAGSLLLVTWLVPRGRAVIAAACIGAAVAIIALLKINAGLLTAAGLVLWLVLSARGLNDWLRWSIVAATAVFAVGLMHTLAGETWTQIYLLVFGAGLVSLVLAVRPETDFPRAIIPAFAAGAIAAAVPVLFAVMARGTNVAGLIDGILLGPLRHAANYAFPPDWRLGTVELAVASLLALLWYRRLRATGRREAADRWLAALRLVHYVWLGVMVVGLIEYRVLGVVFSYAVPWLWIWVVPLGVPSPNRPAGLARDLTACVALLQFLQAYPVGGIQIAWSTFPLFALAALAGGETGEWLSARARWGRALGPVLLILAAGKLVTLTMTAATDYAQYDQLSMPGTAGMRIRPRYAAVCETLSFNAALHADRLFSLPGMLSFNLWSKVPPPTLRNTTVWYTLLSDAEQMDILHVLEQSPRACLVVERNVLALLQGGGFPPRGPLVEYLLRQFHPVFSLGGVDFWVRQGRTVAPAGTMWAYRRAEGVTSYRVCLAGADESIAGLALADIDGRHLAPAASAVTAARVTVRPIQADGTPRGAAYQATWPLRFRGLAWIEVEQPATGAPTAEPSLVLLLDETGQRLGAAPAVDTSSQR